MLDKRILHKALILITEIVHALDISPVGVKSLGVPPGLANARTLGRAKLATAPPPGLTRRAIPRSCPGVGGGGGRAQLELTDA